MPPKLVKNIFQDKEKMVIYSASLDKLGISKPLFTDYSCTVNLFV